MNATLTRFFLILNSAAVLIGCVSIAVNERWQQVPLVIVNAGLAVYWIGRIESEKGAAR
jgi:hypothetical protein